MLKLDAYKLKWIAIIAMILNHMVIAWWEIIPLPLAYPMYLVGGLTFPIMAFFVVEGYKHTSNLKRYVGRILIVGLIALPFHFLTLGLALAPNLNIMFTIALSLGVLKLYDKFEGGPMFWLPYVFIIAPISLFFFEWSFPGVTMVLLFYIIKDEKSRRFWPPVIAILLNFAISIILVVPKMMSGLIDGEIYDAELTGLTADPNFALVSMTFLVGMFASSFVLRMYNGERGKKMKWLFYAFYPGHLAVLAIVALILGLVNFDTIQGWLT